jgi:hypothetical protein
VKGADPATAVVERAHDRLENATVSDAVTALRRDHDPARAAMLLDYYLKHYPNGALVEEALALAIEAAATRDRPAAATLAIRYLADHPKGRYRAAAEAANARFKPPEGRP